MSLADLPIVVESNAISRFCREHSVRRLALFGSVLRPDFQERSDVDVLVDYLPGHHPGLMLFRQQEELSTLLSRRVDLHTASSLSPLFRAVVVAESLPLYEQA